MSGISKKPLLFRLWRFVRNLKWILLAAWILAIVKAISGLGLAAVCRWLLNNYENLSPQQLRNIYIAIFSFLILFAVIIYFRVYLPIYISSRVIKEMRRQLYGHLQRLSADFYVRHKSGEIVSRMTNDINMAQLLFSTVIVNVAFDFVTITAMSAYLIFSYPVEIAFPVLGICVVFGLLAYLFFPKIRETSRRVQEEMGRITGDVSEKVSGMKILQSFTREEMAIEEIGERLESHYVDTLRMARLQALFSTFMQFMPWVARFVVIIIGITLIMTSRMTIGDIAGLMLILAQIFFPLNRSSETTVQIGTSIGSLDRVFDFFDAQPTVKENKRPIHLETLEGKIEFQNVDFQYPMSDGQEVLQDLSFVVSAGSQVAFVGPSGGGKSTMMDLISRFYDPVRGAILIDDVDIQRMSLRFLRENIGIVLQDTILFTGTIVENVRIGKPEATDDEVIEALNHAYAWEFVKEMKYGLRNVVGERGVTLSGGQRQRIALARVFLKNPKILILDEATSSLDSQSEYYVQQALERLVKGRTTLMIAHRLSTIKNVDHIYVVEGGRITEHGSREELLKRGGGFKRLFDHQKLALHS